MNNNYKKPAENGHPDDSARENNQGEEVRRKARILVETIDEHFNEEILDRQRIAEKTEIRLCQAKKLLHLVRYSIVGTYYDKKELEYSLDAASTSEGNGSAAGFEKERRLHPAVKKLMAGNQSQPVLVAGKRRTRTRIAAAVKRPQSSPPEPEPGPRKFARSRSLKVEPKLEVEPEVQPKVEPVAEFKLSDPLHKNDQKDLLRTRTRTEYVLIVGNISKRMPSTEDHGLSHKWLVYVRGPQEKADVTDIIDKAVFHLHSSYKPHDVVEVCGPKFHLCRRGWGEFPIRIRLFFKNRMNKPVDIVHDIKLDQTFTGRQTLGRETKCHLLLYDGSYETLDGTRDNETMDERQEQEPTENVSSTSVEHDYCFGNSMTDDEQLVEITNNDHSYSMSPTKEGRLMKSQPDCSPELKQDWNNRLIYGLEYDYDKLLPGSGIKTKMSLSTLSNHLESGKGIKINNNQVQIVNEKFNGVVYLADFNKARQLNNCKLSETSNNFKIKLPRKFKNMGEALPYMFRRLPIVNELASNSAYKRFYPFTCPSVEEYSTWNVGKQRSAEWARAKAIKRILITEQIHKADEWTTKSVLMYGRSHQYTNVPQYKLFIRESEEKNRLLTCYFTSDRNYRKPSLNEWAAKQDANDAKIIDISGNDSPPKRKEVTADISDPNYLKECSFIRQAALDTGVILRSEEIDEGVKFNGAERMIFEAAKCLVENLIRRATNYRVCQGNYDPSTSIINASDIQKAIDERVEVSSISDILKERKRMRQFFKY